jgi:hypothetical protein
MTSPTFTWSGHGAGEITIDQRLAFEKRLTAVIADSFSTLGVVPDRSGPAILRTPASERVGPERYDRALGLYMIPSYDHAGAPVAIDVEGTTTLPEKGKTGTVFRVLVSIEAVWEAVAEQVDIGSRCGPLGVLFEVPPSLGHASLGPNAGVGPFYGLIVAELPERRTIIDTIFVASTGTSLDSAGNITEAPATLPPVGRYQLTWRGGPAQGRQIYNDFYGDALRKILLEQARSAGLDRTSVAKAIAARIEKWIDAQIGITPAAGYALLHGVAKALLSLNSDAISNWSAATRLQDVEILPLAESVQVLPGLRRQPGTDVGGAAEAVDGEEPGELEAEEPEVCPPTGAVGGLLPRRPAVPTEPPALLFPPGARGAIPQVVPDDEGFEGEPSIDDLGPFGQELANLMEEIASRLRMNRGRFAGKFVIDAAGALQHLALETAAWPPAEKATTSAARQQSGNAGPLDVSPANSPQIDFLRHLAGTLPLISYLRDLVHAGYQSRPRLISGRRHCDAPGWLKDFAETHVPMLAWAAGDIFAAACQVVFLQLLNASADAIQARLEIIDPYAAWFEDEILPELRHLDELLRMQVLLKNARRIERLALYDAQELQQEFPDARLANASPVPRLAADAGSWHDATASFADLLQSTQPPPGPPRADAYEIVPLLDRTYQVLDKDGHLWSAEKLERGILLRRGVLESTDPLITQMVDLPDVMRRFNHGSVKDVISSILRDMTEANEATTRRARRSVFSGFQASRISTSAGPLSKQYETATVRGTPYRLAGVHALAHNAIGDAFGGDLFYGLGIDYLFGSERGKEDLLALLEFAGIVVLAIFCPPLAEALGVALAAAQLEHAEERAQTYAALIQPETVLSRAEVEAELFAAELGAALAFLPIGLKIASEARAALRLEQQAAREVGQAAASSARTASEAAGALSQLTRIIEEGFATVFLKEATKAWLINEAIGAGLKPLVDRVAENVRRTGPTGGLENALQTIRALQEQRRRQRRSH